MHGIARYQATPAHTTDTAATGTLLLYHQDYPTSRFLPVDILLYSGYIIARMKIQIILAPEAVEDLKQLAARERGTIRDLIEVHLRHEPAKVSKSRIKRLRGMRRPQYRLRIGDVRVFYDITKNRVEILAIIEKSEAARWLEKAGEKS